MKKKFLLLFIICLGSSPAIFCQQTVRFSPAIASPDDGFGFEMSFTFTNDISKSGEYVLILEKYNIDFAKGFYKKYFSKPTGKYYPCSQLKGYCASSILNGLWVRLIWEYDGKEFSNGGLFTGSQRGSVYEYTGVKNFFTAPSGIPFGMIKSGAAKVKEIKVTSCSATNTDEIMSIISGLN